MKKSPLARLTIALMGRDNRDWPAMLARVDDLKAAAVLPPARAALLRVLAEMPDEAFGWLVVMIAHVKGSGQIWPDGLGGFRPESRASIEAAVKAALAIMNGPGDVDGPTDQAPDPADASQLADATTPGIRITYVPRRPRKRKRKGRTS
jgi:hypothetical protein